MCNYAGSRQFYAEDGHLCKVDAAIGIQSRGDVPGVNIAVALLAAGQGKRMQSHRPKVLHEIAGAPLYFHALQSARDLDVAQTAVVTGHGREAFLASCAEWAPTVITAHQEPRLGTGDALRTALAAIGDHAGPVLVLYGDTPLMRPATLQAMMTALAGGADLAVAGFEARDPAGYGRLITTTDGHLQAIVEEADANGATLDITLCNAGILAGDRALLATLLEAVGNANAAGEYYLTDILGIATARGRRSVVVACTEDEAMGINTRAELARAESIMQERLRMLALAAGATLIDPATVHFSYDTHLEPDVVVEPHVRFGNQVSVASGATIRSFTYLESCTIGPGARVGPHAHIRPGSDIGANVQIGNFVEVKASRLAAGAKANHLSYIGDSQIAEDANIGAGSVTCNYDGKAKHTTRIGRAAFIGSGTMLVAPVAIGDGAMTAAGSVITEDVPTNTRAFGRARQTNKPGPGATKKRRHRIKPAP